MTAARPVRETIGSGGSSRRTRRAVAVLGLVALVSYLADLGTKQLALSNLEGREPIRLLGGAVNLTLTFNSGAAFGLGSDYTWIFTVITITVIGWIGWMTLRLRSLPWGISLGLVLGGALGNLTDRLFRDPGPFVGHVVDMISLFDPYGQVWPIFNLADSSLVAGVLLAVVLEFTGRRHDGTRATDEAAATADAAKTDDAPTEESA